MSGVAVERVRTDAQIASVCAMVWEFFDFLRERYPDMVGTIENYLEEQDVAGELDRFRETFLPPRGEAFVGYANDEPVGCVTVKPHGDDAMELNRMFVRAGGRGLGLGRRLAQSAIDEARNAGKTAVYLDALYRHVEALPLYESLGFEYYTDPNAFGGDDERIIHMKLTF